MFGERRKWAIALPDRHQWGATTTQSFCYWWSMAGARVKLRRSCRTIRMGCWNGREFRSARVDTVQFVVSR